MVTRLTCTPSLVPIIPGWGGRPLDTDSKTLLFHRSGNWSSERPSHSPKVTQLEGSSLKPRPVCFQSPRVNPVWGSLVLSPQQAEEGPDS